MSKHSKVLLRLAVCLLLVAVLAIPALAADYTYGWNENPNGTWSWYDGSEITKNQEIYYNGSCYRVDANGIMLANAWYQDPTTTTWYYYGPTGAKYEGCVAKIGDYYYGFAGNGEMYDDVTFDIYSGEAGQWLYYRAKEGGELYVNEWYTDQSTSSMLYYGADGARYNNCAAKIGEDYYFFDYNGWMLDNNTYSLWSEEEDRWIYYRAKEGGKLYVNEWYETEWGGLYYYGEGGKSAYGFATVDGQPSFFDADGEMLKDRTVTDAKTGISYVLDENGYAAALANNTWTKVGENWYYVLDGEPCRDGVYQIGGDYYMFSWYGDMLVNRQNSYYDEEEDRWVYYCAGEDGRLYVNSWYQDEYGHLYYYGEGGKSAYGFVTVDGQMYYFNTIGGMLANQAVTDPATGKNYYLDENGAATELANNAWTKVGENWYYVLDGVPCSSGVYQIGGDYYMFSWSGYMMVDQEYSFYDQDENRGVYYRAKEDGRLYVNEWYETEWGELYYYGEGGKAPTGFTTVDGQMYFFSTNGYVTTNQAVTDPETGKNYYLDENGAATELPNNTWTQIGEDWYYVLDGELCSYGVYKLGDYYYMFYGNGRMIIDQQYDFYDQDEDRWVYYRADENGRLYVNTWYETNWGGLYYYGEGGKAPRGFATVDGQVYYFDSDGEMLTERAVTDEETGKNYYLDEDGKAVELANNIWTNVGEDWCYVLDGELCRNGLYTIDGTVYAFTYEGYMLADDTIDFYDEELGRWVWYRADKDGKLYVNQWYETGRGERYYYGEGGKAAYGFVTVDGQVYYFDHDGMALSDQVVTDWDTGKHYYLDANGESTLLADNTWTQAGGYWYYVLDGELCRYGVYKLDGYYYAFSENGRMVDGKESYCYNSYLEIYTYHRAQEGGKLIVNNWYQDTDGDWYYYGEYGAAASSKLILGSYTYIFDYNGLAITNRALVWGDVNYVLDNNGRATVLPSNTWTKAGDYWYYAQDGVLCQYGVYKIDGAYYAFDGYAQMVSDRIFEAYFEHLQNYAYCRARDNGSLYVNTWYQDEYGDWFYYGEYGASAQGIVELDGVTYGFNRDGSMASDRIFEGYVLDKNGHGTKMPNNAWTSFDSDWYYILDGQMCQYGIYKIDGVSYYFDYDGRMLSEHSIHIYNEETNRYGYIRADESGKLYQNAWYQDADGNWYYYGEDFIAAEGVQVIDGTTYGFNSEGMMVTDSCVYGNGGYYAFDKNGHLITAQGWQLCGGRWVYVTNAQGKVHNGWYEEGGKKYYLAPDMYHDTIAYIDGKLYFFNANGHAALYTSDGFYGAYYLENGKLLSEEWKQINASWYYFDYSGCYVTGFRYVDDTPYLFSDSGVLQTGGWVRSDSGWAYADENGVLKIGMHTIDGVSYYFYDSGRLATETQIHYQDSVYWADGSGVLTKLIGSGWIDNGDGTWSYFNGEYKYNGESAKIDGKYYAFDYNGIMVTNRVWSSRYYGANGAALSGWIQVGNRWLYADPKDSLYLCDGIETVDGVEYLFDAYYTSYPGVYLYNGKIVTITGNGVVKSKLDVADGWTYVEGTYLYAKNGQPYTGWVDGYLVLDGRMVTSGVYTYEGKDYYFDRYGKLAKKGWLQMGENVWFYVKSDSSLCYNEWLQLGSTWYYFDGYYMADYNLEIDGTLHRFASNGTWLGSVAAVDSGWKNVDGFWYYYHAGTPVNNEQYIEGNWYYFYYDGQMAFNRIIDGYFYTSGGQRASYTGWQLINGEWYFFAPNHQLVYGWFEDGGKTYYQSGELFTGHRYIDGELHKFASSGAYIGKVTQKDGWYNGDGAWYYFENGRLAEGYRKIDGVGYNFDYDGQMVSDNISYVNGVYRYFDSNGREVTRAGWYTLNDTVEVYVNSYGEALFYGVHKINGQDYYFNMTYGFGSGG